MNQEIRTPALAGLLVLALSGALSGCQQEASSAGDGQGRAMTAKTGTASPASQADSHLSAPSGHSAAAASGSSTAAASGTGTYAPSSQRHTAAPGEQPAVETDLDGLPFVRNDAEISAALATFSRLDDALKRADAEGMEAAARALKLPGLAADARTLPLTAPLVAAPFGSAAAAIPTGPQKEGHWSGVQRYFRIGDGTRILLAQQDLAVTGEAQELPVAPVNANINGQPVAAAAWVDGSGRRLRQVQWILRGRRVMLTVLDPEPSTRPAGASLAGRSVLDMARMMK